MEYGQQCCKYMLFQQEDIHKHTWYRCRKGRVATSITDNFLVRKNIVSSVDYMSLLGGWVGAGDSNL